MIKNRAKSFENKNLILRGDTINLHNKPKTLNKKCCEDKKEIQRESNLRLFFKEWK